MKRPILEKVASHRPLSIFDMLRSGGRLLLPVFTAGVFLSEAGAQEIVAGTDQSVLIPSGTAPVAGVLANGANAVVTGTDATIEWNRNGYAVSAINGGVVNLTGGSISNERTVTPVSNVAGVTVGSNGTVNLWDLSVTAISSATTTFNSSKGLNIESAATNARVFASNVSITASGNTTSAEAGAGVRVASSTGRISLSDESSITTSGSNIYGLFAGNGGTIFSEGTIINTSGVNANGVYVNASNAGGSQVTLVDGSVTTTGRNAYGLYGARQSNTTENTRASLSGTNVIVQTSADATHGVFADRGSDFSLVGGSISTSGIGSAGILVQSANGTVTGPAFIRTVDTDISVAGRTSSAVVANASGTANIQGGSISTEGYEGVALLATGTGSTIIASDVTVETDLRAAHGAYATDAGSITISDSSIDVQAGPYAGAPSGFTYGLSADGGGRIVANNVAITTSGSWSYGVSAGGNGKPGGEVTVNGGTVSTSGVRAHGISSVGFGGVISSSAEITTSGSLAVGAQAYSNAPDVAGDSSVVNLTGGSVTTTGESARGIAAVREGAVLNSVAHVTTYGTQSHGGVADRKGVLNVNGGAILTKGLSAVGVLATDGGVANLSNASVGTENYEAIGLLAVGPGSRITADDISVQTAIRAAHGAYALAGGEIEISDSSINVQAGTTEPGSYPGGYTYGLSAAGTDARVIATNVSVTTAQDWSYGVNAGALGYVGGEVTVNGGSVITGGYRAHGLSAVGYGGIINSSADITTSGREAKGAQAYSNGDDTAVVNLTGGQITTSGSGAHGIAAVVAGAQVNSTANVTTQGAASHGAVADRGAVVNLTGGVISTLDETSAGLAVLDGGTISAQNARVSSAGDAILAEFTRELSTPSAVINLGAGSNVSSVDSDGALLRVNRAVSSGGQAGVVTLNLNSGAIAAGNIYDQGARTTGYLDISIAQGAQLTAGEIVGYRHFTIDGSLLGVGTLDVAAGQTLAGTGLVNHNVIVNGGQLSADLIIKGKVTLSDKDVQTVISGSTVVAANTELVAETLEAGAEVDTTAGTATITTIQEGAVLKTGNWGATVENVNGGTIDANQGVVNATNVTAGEITQGTISVNNGGGGSASGQTFTVGADATISGNGTVLADTAIAGNLNPGNSPGSLHFAGALSLDSEATTNFEIGGIEAGLSYDQIVVDGALTYGGVLSVTWVDDFEPVVGQTFQLFALGEGATTQGTFEAIIFSLSGYEGTFNYTTGELTVEAVPEPSTIGLFALAALAFVVFRLRQTRSAA